MMTSTPGARFAHVSSGMLMYMLPWNRRYAGRRPPARTDPCGLLWRTSSLNPSSFARAVAGRLAAIESTSGESAEPPLAFRVLSGINTMISGFGIEVVNARSCISSCDLPEFRGRARWNLTGNGRALAWSPAGPRRDPPRDGARVSPRAFGGCRSTRILPEEDPPGAGDEQVGADAHPAGRHLLKSRGRGVPHQPQEWTGAGHARGTAWTEKRIPSRRTRDRDEGPLGAECAPKRLRSGPESAVWRMPTDRGKRKYKRLFLAADLHGSEVVFRKFLAAATFYEADALLIGGDVPAKSITPIVQQDNGRFQTRLAGAVRDNLSEAELAPIEKAIADSGPYPVRMTEDDYARFRANPDKVESLFTDRMIDQIRRCTAIAERPLATLDMPLYWIGGNDDKVEALLQAESTPHVHYIDEKVARFDEDHEILGFGWTNPSPWHTPREG